MGSTEQKLTNVQKKLRKVKRPFTIFAVVLAATLLLCSLYQSFESNLTASTSRYAKKQSSSIWYHEVFKSIKKFLPFQSSPPIILLWTNFFSSSNWLPELRSLGCKYECNISYDRSIAAVSNAVVFHLRDVDVQELPEEKPVHQKWILFNKEAPPNTPVNVIQTLNGKIDWTLSYRIDSDIYSPYGRTVKKTSTPTVLKPRNSTEDSQDKKYLVCWIVSNLATSSRREAYVQILKSYIPVSIYGKGGNMKCPTTNTFECYKYIESKCKFYLSFENSLCKDYITEKAFHALKTDMIPIVMGGANYTNHLPPNSFINALDFKEPRDLASYIKELDADEYKFQQYHRWKLDYYVQSIAYDWACDLCYKLYTQSEKNKPQKDLQNWWFSDANCISWIDYFDQRQ